MYIVLPLCYSRYMLKKIPIQDLLPGMYVVDSGLSWLEYPYLYLKEGMVPTAEAVAAIVAEGYTEAVIDTELSLLPQRDDTEQAISRSLQELPEFYPPPPLVSVGEEIGNAHAAYVATVSHAKTFMHDVRLGNAVDVHAAEPLIDDIINSVTRNSDALVGLAKLRSFDKYTFTHSVNVSLLSVVFGRFLGKTQEEQKALGLAGLFHDIGKQLVPESVLNKPGKLSKAEFAIMQQHPLLGVRHMYAAHTPQKNVANNAVMTGMLEHHEKFNGSGYPRGLRGDQIHETGRIIAIADIYDALTSRRVYKQAMPAHKALGLMYSMRGKEFHPGYVERFIKCLGVYPVGSTVRLNTGHIAVVAESNPKAPLQPQIIVVSGAAGPIAPRKLDLAGQHKLRIEASVNPATCGVNPVDVLEFAA